IAGHVLDELDAPKTNRGPILVDGDHAYRLKAGLAERLPAVIAIDLTLVLLRAAFRVREPDHRVALGAFADGRCQLVELGLPGDKGERKLDFLEIAQIARDLDAFERFELGFKALRRAKNHDLRLILQIELLKRGEHGYLRQD